MIKRVLGESLRDRADRREAKSHQANQTHKRQELTFIGRAGRTFIFALRLPPSTPLSNVGGMGSNVSPSSGSQHWRGGGGEGSVHHFDFNFPLR